MKTDDPNQQADDAAPAARGAWFIQQTQIGKYHTRSGHGFSAEDDNALMDVLSGRRVEQVGKANTLNGPDRIVDGVAVQTKYCQSPASTFKAAFDADGQFRYGDQVLEVPRGQREAIVPMMKEAIADGRVPGVDDPARADSLVREGRSKYRQARGIARPGNVDSILFDARLHAANAVLSAGITFATGACQSESNSGDQPANEVRSGRRWRGALKQAAISGAKTLVGGVATSQAVRTRAARKMTVALRGTLKCATKAKAARKIVDAVASASCGKTVRGAAATNHVARLTRSSVIGGAVSVAMSTAPNIGRAMVGRMEWSVVARRGAESVAATGAGMAGWTLCFTGTTLLVSGVLTGGASIVVAGVVGTVGSIAAGEGAGMLTRAGLKAALGDDREAVPDASIPAWLDRLMWLHAATTVERQFIKQQFGAMFDRYRRFDSPNPDAEALEQARDLVVDSLAAHRVKRQAAAPLSLPAPIPALNLASEKRSA